MAMIRNRRAQADALVCRFWIAGLLAGRSQLDAPLTDEQLRRLLELDGKRISLAAIKRHRRWVRREHEAGRLPRLIRWVEAARRGPLPPWEN
jgi:hypothetical protein